MPKVKYIYHVFDTLDWRHVRLSLESIAQQTFDPCEFLLYNPSSLDSLTITALAKEICKDKFSEYVFLSCYPKTTRTVDDVRWIVDNVKDSDSYFVHKADFVLCDNTIQNAFELLRVNPDPMFVNFCKFDLRESLVDSDINRLSKMTYDQIIKLEGAVDDAWHIPLELKHDKIGYCGHDGVMHFYNEEARNRLDIDTFTSIETVKRNQDRGVMWLYGLNKFLALHLWHDIGGRSDNKNIVGYRF